MADMVKIAKLLIRADLKETGHYLGGDAEDAAGAYAALVEALMDHDPSISSIVVDFLTEDGEDDGEG